MFDMIHGERYKLRRGNLSKIMILIYIFAGVLYFIKSRTFLDEFDLQELAKDDTISIFSFMLTGIAQYGTEIRSTILILGVITVFGLLTALCIVPIFTAITVTDEYSTRSIQQLTCKGISRYKIILSKYYGICEFVTVTNCIMCILGIALITVTIGQGNVTLFLSDIFYFVLKIIMLNLAFIAICLFFSVVIKYCGAAMPVNFIIIVCFIGELASDLFSSKILFPIITYLAIIIISLVATIYVFSKSDI